MPKSLRPNLYRTIKIVMSDGATFRVPSAVRTVGNTLQLDRDPANHPAYLVRAAASLAQSPCATEAHRESPPPRPVLLYRVRPISRVCLVVARSSALSECGPKPSRTSSISVYCVGRATRVRFPCKRSRCHALLTPTACGSLHSGACSVRSPHFDARQRRTRDPALGVDPLVSIELVSPWTCVSRLRTPGLSLSPLSARLTRSSLMHATVLSRAHATPSRLMSAACAWAWACPARACAWPLLYSGDLHVTYSYVSRLIDSPGSAGYQVSTAQLPLPTLPIGSWERFRYRYNVTVLCCTCLCLVGSAVVTRPIPGFRLLAG